LQDTLCILREEMQVKLKDKCELKLGYFMLEIEGLDAEETPK